MNKLVIGIIAAVIIGGAAAAVALSGPSGSMQGTEPADPGMVETRTVDVGVLLPATGDLSSHGNDNKIATELGAMDYNEYLESQDADWRINLVIEDTQTNPIVALEKIQSLNAKGIKYVLGPETSAELRNIKSYADSNDMILISPSSTSPKLAFDDNIFRFIPDDTKQGRVIAALLEEFGVDAIVPVYRGDVWGDGLYESSRDSFMELGGTVDEGIRYSPEVTVFSTEAKALSDIVAGYQEQNPDQEVAVLMIGFAEVVHFFNSASSYDNLGSVRWIGTDASSNDDTITGDEIASTFAKSTRFVATQFSASDNQTYDRVKQHLIDEVGSAPNNYAYSAYDSVFVLGNTLLETDGSAAMIKQELPNIAAQYTGAIGTVNLNDAGDLAIADYELWYVTPEGEWDVLGRYSAASDSVTIFE